MARASTSSPAASSASSYKLQTCPAAYDAAAAASGTRISNLGDDDTHEFQLPFAFPFYGQTYTSLWINSNGNLTFEAGDGEISDTSYGRLLGGSPRIAPLFADLDPTAVRQGSVRVLAGPNQIVITYDRVPLYSDFGSGAEQTFQVKLAPTGQIDIAFNGVSAGDSVTGISPATCAGQPRCSTSWTGPPLNSAAQLPNVMPLPKPWIWRPSLRSSTPLTKIPTTT